MHYEEGDDKDDMDELQQQDDPVVPLHAEDGMIC